MSYQLKEDINYDDKTLILGEGAYGTVCLIYDHHEDLFIAVKKIKRIFDNPAQADEQIRREVVVQTTFSRFVPFVPLLHHKEAQQTDLKYIHYFYMDFVCGGSLDDIIRQRRTERDHIEFEEDWEEEDIEDNKIHLWGLCRELIIAYGVARALQYMHQHDPIYLHRDIKPENILMTHNLEPKLADFGGGRVQNPSGNMTVAAGTWLYNAPEKGFITEGIPRFSKYGTSHGANAETTNYGPKSDIYSYAVTMYEMITLIIPYSDQLPDDVDSFNDRIAIRIQNKILKEDLKPSFPEGFEHPLVRLIKECWTTDPSGRPGAQEVCSRIREIAESFLDNEDKQEFDSYVSKVEEERNAASYEGTYKNVIQAINNHIAGGYRVCYKIYLNGIHNHEKNPEKAQQFHDNANYLLGNVDD